ncbi:hypothetical protein ARMGADRAFT_471347 [Armillaria gallica]|uniref:Uncharacterized protein n=1 Tax=Armillaria gallica TaxID=47427 RepID=A0A2H3CYJ4_ARMGA|nr:hypothetical protein ARMGADRAFT_471347 [Armillaria gallica]
MTYILLLNISVRKDVDPAIWNPVTVSKQDKATKEMQALIEKPTARDGTSAWDSEAAIKVSTVCFCVFSNFPKRLTQTSIFIGIRTS